MTKKEILERYIYCLELLINDHYNTGLKDELKEAEKELLLIHGVVVNEVEFCECKEETTTLQIGFNGKPFCEKCGGYKQN